jgi:hypothetical protein
MNKKLAPNTSKFSLLVSFQFLLFLRFYIAIDKDLSIDRDTFISKGDSYSNVQRSLQLGMPKAEFFGVQIQPISSCLAAV